MVNRTSGWIADWSHSPYSEWVLFAVSAVESSVFPIPPDVLLLAMAAGNPRRSLRFAIICSAGSVLGGILGYSIGLFAFDAVGEALLNLYDPQREVFLRVEQLYQQWGFWSVLAAAVTPIPYKVFTIASGVFHFSFPLFVLASVVGRSARFLLVGGLMRWGGERLQRSVGEYFDWVLGAVLVLLVSSVVFLKFL